MDITAISAQMEKYENKWIAIDESEEKIVGVGDDAFEATESAERSGYQDTILFKVPSFDSALSLGGSENVDRPIPERLQELTVFANDDFHS